MELESREITFLPTGKSIKINCLAAKKRNGKIGLLPAAKFLWKPLISDHDLMSIILWLPPLIYSLLFPLSFSKTMISILSKKSIPVPAWHTTFWLAHSLLLLSLHFFPYHAQNELLEKEINAYRAWRNWKNCLRSITTTLLANFFTRVSVLKWKSFI